ncbi:serine/threonine-protein phosphatase [Streptomyces scopuliridis]|uniref:Serine/threonine-protein phosphatase n=1 Tax=Streptomyces scopuliridis TaxID=452529 RepID=A0ACD4ZW81_9ACTN|nr:PP2C family protein-serine/threonine phosphatase [Streptomyces scopuliridis]WSC02566.1 serine/threonine-protein phosphatase [Streptomyces scopuliridis]WSC03902.1 serine/threonine-protein phosphatase [Streptomyces scopuliridis]
MATGSPAPGNDPALASAPPPSAPDTPAPAPAPLPGDVPSAGERLLEALLTEVHTAAPMDLPRLVDRCATMIGLESVVIYLVDIQQRHLIPLTRGLPTIELDTSTPGWAYRTIDLRVEENPEGGLMAWLPLVDGAERLGILGIRTAVLDPTRLRRCRMLASVLAMAITSKRAYSDSFARQSRTEPMDLPAEMLRSLLPPRTIGNNHAVSTAVLEPAYHIGGDAFDHSLTQSTLHAAIFDAMGHNLASGLTTTVAVAGCRNARRAGAELPELVAIIDQALGQWLPDQYCTGIITQLNLAEGVFRWCNCGHPPPLLIRGQRVLDAALERPAQPPMGLPAQFATTPRTAHEVMLEPGDRVLLYTDGVTEARIEGGDRFGLRRFTDSIIRGAAAGEPAAEALRRIIHSILDHQKDQLRDDATLLLIEWRPPRP